MTTRNGRSSSRSSKLRGGVLKSAHLTEEDEIIKFAKDADAIIVQYAPITRKVLSSLPKCKIVSRYGIGIDNVDLEAAKELGVYVAHNPQYCINEVSDHAIAMILSLQRQITHGTEQVKQGIWDFTKLTPVKAADQTTHRYHRIREYRAKDSGEAESLRVFTYCL